MILAQNMVRTIYVPLWDTHLCSAGPGTTMESRDMESDKPVADSTSQKEEPLNQGKILSIVLISKMMPETINLLV